MMRKNVASQNVGFQMNAKADGEHVTTGTPTVYVTIDGGTQSTGGGTSAHEGNGAWNYVPTQAETNGNHVAFTMVLTNAISQTVNVYPVAYNPADSVRLGLTALPNAAADAAGGLPVSDAGGLDLDAFLGRLDAAVTTRSSHSAADVWTSTTRTLSAFAFSVTVGTNNDKTGYSLATTPPTAAAIADAVWDEVITGAEHNVNNSAAKFLREGSEAGGLTGEAQSATSTTVVLASGAVSVDDLFNDEQIFIIEGTGAGQGRLITDSVASSDTVTVDRAWTITPDATSVYVISGADVSVRSLHGDNTASSNLADDYNGTGYAKTNSTVGTVTDVTTKTGYSLTSTANNAVADAVWDEATSGHTTAGTFGKATADVLADTDELQTDWANGGRLDLILDATSTFDPTTDTIETGITWLEYAQYTGAVLAGQIADAGTGTETFKAIGNAATTRVTVTVDANGVRSGVTFS